MCVDDGEDGVEELDVCVVFIFCFVLLCVDVDIDEYVVGFGDGLCVKILDFFDCGCEDVFVLWFCVILMVKVRVKMMNGFMLFFIILYVFVDLMNVGVVKSDGGAREDSFRRFRFEFVADGECDLK